MSCKHSFLVEDKSMCELNHTDSPNFYFIELCEPVLKKAGLSTPTDGLCPFSNGSASSCPFFVEE